MVGRGEQANTTTPSIVIAGEQLGLDEALKRLERYPSRTPAIYDYPGPGDPSVIDDHRGNRRMYGQPTDPTSSVVPTDSPNYAAEWRRIRR